MEHDELVSDVQRLLMTWGMADDDSNGELKVVMWLARMLVARVGEECAQICLKNSVISEPQAKLDAECIYELTGAFRARPDDRQDAV